MRATPHFCCNFSQQALAQKMRSISTEATANKQVCLADRPAKLLGGQTSQAPSPMPSAT